MPIHLPVVVASGNVGKIDEFTVLCDMFRRSGSAWRIEIVSAAASTLPETERSFAANARLKARHISAEYTMAALGDDSGLRVDALGGEPGLRTARFGGPDLLQEERNGLVLRRLAGVPPAERTAHFVCALSLALPDGRTISARGRVDGLIAEEPRGRAGFGYDPLFLLPSLGLTMAELSAEEKHSCSHRGRAVRRLLLRLEQGLFDRPPP